MTIKKNACYIPNLKLKELRYIPDDEEAISLEESVSIARYLDLKTTKEIKQDLVNQFKNSDVGWLYCFDGGFTIVKDKNTLGGANRCGAKEH